MSIEDHLAALDDGSKSAGYVLGYLAAQRDAAVALKAILEREAHDPDEYWPSPRVDLLSVRGMHQKDRGGHCTGCVAPAPGVRVRWPCQKARLTHHIATLEQEVQRLRAARDGAG